MIRSVKMIQLLSALLMLSGGLLAQDVTIYTSARNTAGGSGAVAHPDFGTFYLDWSLGENTIVSTTFNGNLITTNGMLQPALNFKSEADLGDIDINFYPNPTSNFSWIDITISNQTGKLEGQVYNMLGQLVIPATFTVNSSGKYRIDFSKLPSGMYVLWIRYTSPYSMAVRRQSYKVIKTN